MAALDYALTVWMGLSSASRSAVTSCMVLILSSYLMVLIYKTNNSLIGACGQGHNPPAPLQNKALTTIKAMETLWTSAPFVCA